MQVLEDVNPATSPEAASNAANDGIVVEGIGKTYKERAVVKSVSLKLGRGEVVGLLGPNGAGKTTCFYMITGLIAADYGRIVLDGEDITAQPMYQRARMGVGYLPQETSIFRGMSVWENVMAVVELRQRDPRQAKPLAGSFSGAPSAYLGMEVDVLVSKLTGDPNATHDGAVVNFYG